MNSSTPIEDFATAPGVTLQDTLDALGMKQTELAERAGLSQKTINRIVKGDEPITHKTALALEKVLRVPAHFWLNLESRYREHLARVEEQQGFDDYADWARQFPYPAMVKIGLVEAAREAREKAVHLLAFFGVANPEGWKSCYCDMDLALSYRKSAKCQEKLPGLSAWLREGERLALKTETAEFDAEAFLEALSEIRGFTRENPGVFYPKMQKLCRDAGVVYHLVPELPGLGISGVMRWFRGRPMIQQSLLFKSNDQFWFTFFHEGRHVLQRRKKTIFLEGEASQPEDAEREEEANDFAADLLIPRGEWKRFVSGAGRFGESAIRRFADEVRIHPGIVAGRLLREKRIDYGAPQAKLRAKFVWTLGG